MAEQILCVKKFGALRPADEQSVEVLRRIADGDVVKLELTRPTKRSIKQARLFWALMEIAADHMGWTKEQTAVWVKIACGHTDVITDSTGVVTFCPKSISFSRLDQPSFQKFFDHATQQVIDRLMPEGTGKGELVEEIFARAG